MGNDNGETLPRAGRRGGSGCGHFLGGGAAGGRLRKACRRGSNTLAPGDHKIVDRLALLDLSMQFEPRMTRLVHSGLLLPVGHAGRHGTKRDRRATRRRLLRSWRLGGGGGGRCGNTESEADTDRDSAAHHSSLFSRRTIAYSAARTSAVELT